MLILPGPASQELGIRVGKLINAEIMETVFKEFPDGESYFRIPSMKGQDVVIFQGTHPPQDKHLMQLFLLSSGLRAADVKNIRAVVPYLAYSRQDREFLKGEVVSLSVILELMRSAGIEELVTVNPHSTWIAENAPLKVVVLDAVGLLARHITGLEMRDLVVASLGKKGATMAKTASSILKAEYVPISTTRDPYTGSVELSLSGLDLRGRDVFILDDLISTGGTMALAVAEARRAGARRVVVGCVHGLFLKDADRRIMEAGAERIISTDSVPSKYSVVSISGIIAEHLSKERK